MSSVGAHLLSEHLAEPTLCGHEKQVNVHFFFFDSEHSYAWEELYEVFGVGQVDGSPPVPVAGSLR
eukprot:1267377-Pyramimonas_sp.AAC.1